jgi:hypothetical protein
MPENNGGLTAKGFYLAMIAPDNRRAIWGEKARLASECCAAQR